MNSTNNKIAVIGMACRFPGANDLEEYWNNLILGKDTIKHFDDEELENFEPDFDNLKKNPDYVRARGTLDNIDKFDSGFFGLTPKEAEATDPQHRIWLETAWEAFENAGCDPINYHGAIGVFAGGYISTYLLNSILRDPVKMGNYIRLRNAESYQILTGNDPSFIATKTAYKFNLRGPAINVQTACSTSLVAIVQACQSLFSFESDICLSGGICISVPQETGYIYQEGAILSPDGCCRPFDAQAKGTVPSNGVGAVILKRMEDAIRDRDTIYAVVSGWALNNDGSNKVSYTAPSISGQAEVIKIAQSFAEVSPEEISYIEAHGTATQLGDPIEMAALTKAFSAKTNKKQFCGIGSVKSNIGHTDAAAGVASFIKTCLAAYHKKIPASLNFSKANPHIDFENSPFYVQKELREWNEDKPLIMGVSSFGIGGTNAHVIVEEPPLPEKRYFPTSEWPDLIVLSAKSESSLNRRKRDLVEFIKTKPDLNINDVSYTLESGRNHMLYRSFIVASGIEEIISEKNTFSDEKKDNQVSKIAFLFPGQGAQYVNMGKDLYNSNETFRNILDECFKIVKVETGKDIKSILFDFNNEEEANKRLAGTEMTQPALFIIEYALTKILEQIDIKPDYLIGHSIGEYTAACIAGVFDMQTALKIVIKRGQLMQKMPSGCMMSVRTSIGNLQSLLNPIFEIAADNSSTSCTISFKTEDVEKVKALLDQNDIKYIPLNTSHAFHSAAFDPIISEFSEYVNKFKLNTPEIPFISCLTGSFITHEQATSGEYWAKQLRNTVLFHKGISAIAKNEETVFLEVGPDTHLSSLVRQNKEITNKSRIISTLGKSDNIDERYKVLSALGNLYNIGIRINFEALKPGSKSGKISLPGYPFERKRHWIEYEQPKVTEVKDIPVSKTDNELLVIADRSSSDSISEQDGVTDRNTDKIVSIWKSLTGNEEIGLDDDFFEMGGHSLLALQIITRIKEELGFKISLKDFLDHSTINRLWSRLAKEYLPQSGKDELVVNVDLNNFPVTNTQKRIWIISQLEGLNPAYNIPFSTHFKGELDIDVFQKSINVLFKRHFIMFSVFKQKDGNPYCEINPRIVVVEQIDYSDVSPVKSEEKILTFIGDDSRKQFNLETGPLYRLYLLKQNNTNFFFHVTIHHLIFDGWSLSVFLHDLKAIYNSLIQNKEVELSDVKTYYLDYARGLHETDAKLNEELSTKFWIENLKGTNPQLNFAYDYPRKDVMSGFGEKEDLKISAEYTTKLKEIAKEEHATIFSTLLSFLGVLLKRYSSENDICIGTHVSNRNHSSLEDIFGMFVNTIPIRLQIDETQKIKTFINYTKNTVLEAIAHQELPFEKIVEIVNPERSPNVNPIFQVAVVWLANSAKPFEMIGVKGERVSVKEGISPFDITFNLWENAGQIEGEIEYNIDILKRKTIIRLRDNFVQLVQSIVENPDQTISEISSISENDKKMLAEFNNTEVSFTDCFIQNLFEEQSVIHSKKTAVISGNSSLTYKELNEKSNQIAWHLISLGVTGGDVVGICIERSVDMVVSVLGVLKAGCCYLPMDPSFPDDRISYMYEDSGARVLISQSSLKEKFSQFPNTSIVLTDTDKNKISKYSTKKPDLDISTQELAYMIYTSGSTGKPKGVKVHHQAVVNFLNSMSKKPGFSKEDCLLAVTTLSFDISVLELFMPLSFGAKLVVADTDDIFDGQKLSGLLELNDITVMQATPATWNILLGSGWKGKKNLKTLCGGEAITPGLVKELLPKVDSLWNMYGPTETTVWSTCSQLTDYAPPILVGTPIDNTTIHILDKNNNQLPVEVIGEVSIGGLGVTKGYHNRPELTAEKFIPFENGKIIYKTGDLGRYLADGNIELFGRSDNQIKLRGFRIEPGEIESLLSQLSGVKEAVVKVHKFGENDERLVAFLNTDTEFKLTDEAIAASLSQNLPSYMIPSFFQTSDGFPRLPNGKINKKALIFETNESDKPQEIDIESLTPTQQKLIHIWENILKIKNINPSKSFFDIGGNSLLVIRILNKIKEELGFTLSFKTFLAYPTVIQSANYIDSQSQITDKAIELVHLTQTTNLPLTFNQKRLWLISRLQPNIPLYIIPFTNKLSGFLNLEIFEKSLDILFHRHHIMFSTVKEVNGEPYCDIVPSKVNISFIDYSGLPENERSEKVNEIFSADSVKTFDLENGPLYRVYIIMTATNEYYFRISIHHIVFDGWSWGVLVKDLNEIYNSLLNGKEIDLEEIEFQQYDFAQWEKKSSGSKHEDESKKFWKEILEGSNPILNFPYDFQRTTEPSGLGGYEPILLSQDLSEKLRSISKKEDSSLFATMLSAFGLQIQKYSGEDDINIGLPIAYRPHSKLENILGMFVNTVVVRLRNEKEFTFRDVIHHTNDTALNAIAHQDLPFEKVVEMVNPERSSNANPLFQVAFDWQNNLGGSINMNGIRSEYIAGKDRTSIFDITLYLWENDSQIKGGIEYNIDILRRDTIIRLRDNFIQLIQSIAENPGKAISEISLISENDKKMLAEFNNTEVSFPDCFVQNLFEEQSVIHSKKTAVISGNSSLTYKELNEKSNQIAWHLISLGVTGGDVVGICIERSVDMVVSVLGVLKAGCCYLPMDPSFPDDRISYMYEDSGARVLISQSSLKEKFRQFPNTSIILIDSDKNKIRKYKKVKPELKINNQELAYMIYTSGSTGKPKGVKVHHESVVNLIESMSKNPGIKKDDILLAVVTLSFDMSVFELFLPLSKGATVVVASSRDTADGQALINLIDKYNITMLQATPSLWNILLAGGWKGKNDLRAFCGGEALTKNMVRQILPKVAEFWNCYGPTETTVYATFIHITDPDVPILIGRPLNNTTIHILDKNNNQLPVGVIGEVCIGGLCLSKGYNNRPELTAEKFITFENGRIIYKTGDLGRYLSDGNIELFGRIDNQIKLRGFRIEPGEIESLLSRLSGVKEAVVKIHKFDENDERLVAFLNTGHESKLTKEMIVRSLSQYLPGYMIPSFFQTSDGFPRLPNGKINKKALILEIDESDKKNEIDINLKTFTPTELKIYDIWCEALKTKDISKIDNFFNVGGNSLLALTVFLNIKSAFNVDLGLRVFFDCPRIKDIAEVIEISIHKDAEQRSFTKTISDDTRIIEGEI
ncbi:MAG: amino acid adenylation domain-containing protein [Bacteroidota bacterium]